MHDFFTLMTAIRLIAIGLLFPAAVIVAVGVAAGAAANSSSTIRLDRHMAEWPSSGVVHRAVTS